MKSNDDRSIATDQAMKPGGAGNGGTGVEQVRRISGRSDAGRPQRESEAVGKWEPPRHRPLDGHADRRGRPARSAGPAGEIGVIGGRKPSDAGERGYALERPPKPSPGVGAPEARHSRSVRSVLFSPLSFLLLHPLWLRRRAGGTRVSSMAVGGNYSSLGLGFPAKQGAISDDELHGLGGDEVFGLVESPLGRVAEPAVDHAGAAVHFVAQRKVR